MKWLNKVFGKKKSLPSRLPFHEELEGNMFVERIYDYPKEDWWFYVTNTYRNEKLIKSQAFGFFNELLLEFCIDSGLKFYSSQTKGLIYHYPDNYDCNNKAELLLITNIGTGLNMKLKVLGEDQYLVQGTNQEGQAMSQKDCLNAVVSFRENRFWGEKMFGYWRNRYQFPLNANRPRRFISFTRKPIEFIDIEINGYRYRAKFGSTEFKSM